MKRLAEEVSSKFPEDQAENIQSSDQLQESLRQCEYYVEEVVPKIRKSAGFKDEGNGRFLKVPEDHDRMEIIRRVDEQRDEFMTDVLNHLHSE